MSGERTAADLPLPGGDFRMLVTRLSFQGMMSLGMLENPLTGKKASDEKSARMIIDDLLMIREKTSGNLETEEAEHLNRVLESLEVAWAELDKGDSVAAES
ncbi:MAG: DUF1844 domain-containing protein [Planctomycetota bacterium]|jgi:hypothetical protein|nr:hypothetical protein [Planctomycetota bacterium]MDP6369408.1 DUF1844 domain-containing protein [Planctomycetota bacterium]MDP6838438.1 DUF1844 domain-containing protein [Planctomycetota bacterium]MDP6955607.1 DUF1844 domain-containing protein [Planctomycetota bacterium]